MAYGPCSTCHYYENGRCDNWEAKKLSSESCNYYYEDYEKTLNERSPSKICSNCEEYDSASDFCNYQNRRVNSDDHCSHFSYA